MAKFLFLLPKDYKSARSGAGAAVAAAADPAAAAARRAARVAAIARHLHLDPACEVECVAVRLFLASPRVQTRCFIVKINCGARSKAGPRPDDELDGAVFVDGRHHIVYPSTHLCALQMLLNKALSFPTGLPVATKEIGAAFIQIIVPSLFNQIENHKKTLFDVTSYILRNVFAHMRDDMFRRATRSGGVLSAAALWLHEKLCDAPSLGDDSDDSMWRPFDIAEYLFHGSHFAYVFPLCYRRIREELRLRKEVLPPRLHTAILKCMPASSPDFEIPSTLDWYFDHEGKECSLRVLMAINDDAELRRRVGGGAGRRGAKPGRFTGAPAGSFCNTFYHLMQRFFDMTLRLKRQKQQHHGGAGAKAVFFCRDSSFSIDSTARAPSEGLVWLGLGCEETIIETAQAYCKPVAIKSRQNVDPAIFARMMGQMKPGSFIASARETRLSVHGLDGSHADPSPKCQASAPHTRRLHEHNERFMDEVCSSFTYAGVGTESAAGAAAAEGPPDCYWVSEAGICTLHELLQAGVSIEERGTQAHRRLVQEVRCVDVLQSYEEFAASPLITCLLFLSPDPSKHGHGCAAATRVQARPLQPLPQVLQGLP